MTAQENGHLRCSVSLSNTAAPINRRSTSTPGSEQHKVLIRRLPSGGSKVQGSKVQSQIGKLPYFKNFRKIDAVGSHFGWAVWLSPRTSKAIFSGRGQRKA
jgi:hypothetical protein